MNGFGLLLFIALGALFILLRHDQQRREVANREFCSEARLLELRRRQDAARREMTARHAASTREFASLADDLESWPVHQGDPPYVFPRRSRRAS